MEKIFEYEIKCPVCENTIKVSDYLYEAPFNEKLIISGGVCEKCGYKYSDVRLAESKGPLRIRYIVENEKDVNAIMVRSSTGIIRIPELGVEIIPGIASQGFITTIEGVILDVLEKAKFLCETGEVDKNTCEEKVSMLMKASNGELKYTVELIDPSGLSTIVSDKAVSENLSYEELEKIIAEIYSK